jgi:DNA invertase Pin-like site-specific DNA recombinase
MKMLLSNTNRSRVIGYVRVSTTEQRDSGLGLAAQRAAIEAECRRREWRLHELFEDAGVSGRKLNRPGIQAALTSVEAANGSILVVAKLDRLSRSLVDFAGLMARAHSKQWNLVALDLGIDLTTPAGQFLANVMASAAQWERRIIASRTREALSIKKEQGTRLGRPVALPDDIRLRIERERTAGKTLRAIISGLESDQISTASGVGRWHPTSIAQVLRSLELDREAARGSG